jgi:hypothetical protein
MSNSNIETITREHDNFSSSYNELVNLLEKVITNRKITQDDKYDLEKAHATYVENYNDVKRILENEKEANLREQIKAVNDNKLDADINSIVNILTNNGEKNTLYLDEDGNLYIDGEKIPEIKQVKLTVDEQNGKIESLVSDGFIEDAEGNKVKLKVLYSTLSQTVNGIETNVGTIEGVANDAHSKAEAAISKASQLKQTMDGFTTKVEDMKSTLDITVTRVYNEFYISTSSTELIGGSWSTTKPNVTTGYIWMRTAAQNSKGEITYDTPTCLSGIDGKPGESGATGVSITNTEIFYYMHNSKTSAPDVHATGWTKNIPDYVEGKFLWYTTKITYSNGNTTFTPPNYLSSWEAKHEASKALSMATQTAEMFQWVVKKGSTQSSLTLTDATISAIAKSNIKLKADNISLEGYTTINGGFSIDEDGNMTANNGNFNGAVNAQGNMTADTLIVRKIISKDIINSIASDISVTIATDGDDASSVTDNAKFYTVQGFLDALPKNLNGTSIYITLNKECNENLTLDGFSNGDIYMYMNMKNYNGNIAGYNCTAKLFIYGATTVTGIPDGVNSQRPDIMPASMVSSNTYYYGMYFSNCNFVTLRSINVYGQTTSNSYYAIGVEHGTTLLMQNCKVIGSQNGLQARGSKLIMYKNYGKVNNNAVRAIYGATVCIQDGSIPNGQLTHDNSSQIIYNSAKCTVDGTTTTVGENTNIGTTTSKSVTFTSDYGDTYRYAWSDWAQDNLVIQGKWTSNSVGCWFFGSDFSKLQGKTITKVVLKIERTSGGSSSNNEAKIVMHNHSSRPSGEPAYLSWSKTANLTMNTTTTVTITDSAVLNAIKNGTMKGFGLKHTFDKAHYMKCTGVIKATITYQD